MKVLLKLTLSGKKHGSEIWYKFCTLNCYDFIFKSGESELAFNNDDLGNEVAQVVKSMLPQARRIAPAGVSCNEILVKKRQQQQEIVEQKQRSRGFSR